MSDIARKIQGDNGNREENDFYPFFHQIPSVLTLFIEDMERVESIFLKRIDKLIGL